MIAFLPAAGVFYCAREQHRADVGVDKLLVPLDMSWLRMQREELPNGAARFTFGRGGYVRRFWSDQNSPKLQDNPCLHGGFVLLVGSTNV